MTPLEKIRTWLATYKGFDILSQFQVDYTDKVPNVGSVAPSGLVEVDRRKDILGNVTVENQYNFALYFSFVKVPRDDIGATINADWIMDFQEWVQAQSATGAVPIFGDIPRNEKILAQNGVLYEATDERRAIYMVQLSVRFTKKFEVKNEWLT